MRLETKTDGNGNEFEVPIDYRENEFLQGKFHKVRKKNTNFTPKKKKRK